MGHEEEVDLALVVAEVAADAALAGAGTGVGLLGALAGAVRKHSAAARMEASISQSMAEWLEERVADLERGLRDLEGRVDGLRPTDALPVIESLARAARTTGDPNKRHLLEAAARNAFDPGLYQSGLTVVLLEKLERLSYGDVALLRSLTTERGINDTNLDAHHAAVLAEERLIYLRRFGGSSQFNIGRTDLGSMMLRLLADESTTGAATG